jgi:flagellar hook-associated protein 3 FlgL
VRDLTVQAGNGSTDSKGLAAIAAEIIEIKNTILGNANTQYQGRAVFAGTSATETAFASTAPYAYAGDTGTVERTISPGVTMAVNIQGQDVYGAATVGGDTLFAQLDKLAANISAGQVGTDVTLGDIDSRINATTTAMARIGAKTNQLDHAEDVNTNQLQYLETQLQDVSGVDTAKAYLEITAQSVAYQAALQVTAKTVQTSLVDFLR